MSFVGVIGVCCLDILYGGLSRMPQLGEEVYCKQFDVQVGGSNATVATRLGELGAPVKFGSFFGPDSDYMSVIPRDYLARRGVMVDYLYHWSLSPIMVASIASFAEDRFFLTRDSEVDVSAELTDERMYEFLRGAKCVLAMHGHDALFRRLRAEGATVAYDIGWNDDLCLDDLRATLSAVSVFTPNDKEARKMTGIDNLPKAVREIAKFVDTVIVTCGGDGSITLVEDKIIQVPVCAGIIPVDFTGAGDNYMAGLLYGFYHDWSVVEAMRFASIIGGISTTALGCTAAPVSLAAANELMKNI